MDISKETMEVLKNFSTINNTLFIVPGNTIRVCGENHTIIGEAVVEEQFPQEFAISDVTKLLALLSLNSGQPQVEFEETNLVFSALEGRSQGSTALH